MGVEIRPLIEDIDEYRSYFSLFPHMMIILLSDLSPFALAVFFR
jgi:hypothetical protein